MKKSSYLIPSILAIGCWGIPISANALSGATICRAMACTADDAGVINLAQNCSGRASATCVGGESELVGVTTCILCPSGYTMLTKTTTVNCGSGTNTLQYKTCALTCTSSNCKSDTSWSAAGTGYQQLATRSCSDSTTCKTTYSYRCAAGYYGSTTNGTSGVQMGARRPRAARP